MILPWKKSEPPPAFVADPAKAARYAEKAREAMRKGEWTYSLTMFAMSVKFDPNNLVVHGEMYDAAIAHHNAGGKAAASSDVKMIDGGGLVDRFAVSQYQWFCNCTPRCTTPPWPTTTPVGSRRPAATSR